MTSISELEALARGIPEMGGRRIGSYLRSLARDAKPRTSIVELGCWLGAGTAQMALGLSERDKGHGVTIDSFDSFRSSASSAAKAQMQSVDIHEGQDTLPWVEAALAPFGPGISLHKGMLSDTTTWNGCPISVYVDDASKYPRTFYTCLKVFGPSWRPGETTVVLMDYWLFRKPKGRTASQLADLRCQFEFMEKYGEHFEPVASLEDSACAAFRYMKLLPFDALKVPQKSRMTALKKRFRNAFGLLRSSR